jgi:large subunit ribosomal protein L6
MSRVGKAPIPIPSGVSVEIDGTTVRVKGPKGEMSRAVSPRIAVKNENSTVVLERDSEDKQTKSFHGLYRQLIRNMVVGVSEGYKRNLVINGVGYRAELKGNVLALNLGFSNPIEFGIPEGITVELDGPNKLSVSGIDKELVGKIASEIRGLRPPEPYKGKGIRYEDEYVRRKVGKSGIK